MGFLNKKCDSSPPNLLYLSKNVVVGDSASSLFVKSAFSASVPNEIDAGSVYLAA